MLLILLRFERMIQQEMDLKENQYIIQNIIDFDKTNILCIYSSVLKLMFHKLILVNIYPDVSLFLTTF